MSVVVRLMEEAKTWEMVTVVRRFKAIVVSVNLVEQFLGGPSSFIPLLL